MRIQQAVHAPDTSIGYLSQLQNNRMSIHQGDETIFISYNEIYYLEKNGRFIQIHTKNQKIKIRETLKSFEERLKPGFFRSHRSYIINIKQIKRVVNCCGSSYYEVHFNNYDEKALLSRERVNDLMDYFE